MKSDYVYEKKLITKVPSSLLLVLLGWYLLLGFLTQLVEDDMPSVIKEAEIARDNSETFSEETAWRYLKDIVGSGPRVAGTPYHYNKTIDVKAMVDRIAADANQQVLTDWQIVSGNFDLGASAPFVSAYRNVSNVIAVLVGDAGFHPNGTLGTAVLVNCHYDSVPFTVGASDNAVFCSTMMEVLSRMSRGTRRHRNNIVFLFNGAEEMGLLAAHGFLQHAWARGVTAVVNLDAAGMNGKPAMFQVNDPRLLSAYSRAVRRPNAQGLGEFLFASGMVPSDTDFRIFRDFGGIYGVDIAFTKWGHVYHTRYDCLENVQTGVIQNAGNMLMALLEELGSMEELDYKVDPPSAAVYYDFLNVFMLTYSAAAAYLVDAAVLLLAVATVAYYIWMVGPRWSTVRELLISFAGRTVAVGAGVVATLIPVSIMIATTIQLRYLSHAWVLVPFFWVPFLVGAVAASEAFDAWRTKICGLNRSVRALQAQAATRAWLALLLLGALALPALQHVRYLLTVPLFYASVAALVTLTVIRYVRVHAWQHLLLDVALSTPSLMFLLTVVLRLNAMLLPVMGRTPADRPDYTIAFLNIALAALVSTTVSGTELLFSRRRVWLPLGALYAACVVVMFVPMAPYSDTGPATMRHNWMHTEITTYNAAQEPIERRSGVVVLRMDAYTTTSVAALAKAYTTSPVSCERIYCDLPLYRTSFARHLPSALFIDMEGPRPPASAPRAALSAARHCVAETCVYDFTMIGDLHNTITLWPRPNVSLVSWSFAPAVSPAGLHGGDSGDTGGDSGGDRPFYTIVFSHGTHEEQLEPYHFSVTCTVPVSQQSETILEVSHHSHRIQHPEDFTAAYRALLDSAPLYYNVASFLSFRDNYVF